MKGFTLEETIDAFAALYRLWILGFVEKLMNMPGTMPDAGFAILMMLNAYPEMIAQLTGHTGDKPSLFKAGLVEIFPEVKGDREDEVCTHLYSYMRSCLAHMSLTGENILLSEDFPKALTAGEPGGKLLVVVNPRKWCETILQHFDHYIEELKNPRNTALRQKFYERLQKPL